MAAVEAFSEALGSEEEFHIRFVYLSPIIVPILLISVAGFTKGPSKSLQIQKV
jgi:hypothetical protein